MRPRPIFTKRRDTGGRRIVVVVGLLLAGLLAAIVGNQGSGGSSAAAVRSTLIPHSSAVAVAPRPATAIRDQGTDTHATGAHVPAPPGAHVAATTKGSNGLVPGPTHAPPGWAVSVHHLSAGGLDRYYLVARPGTSTTTATVTAAEHWQASPASRAAAPSEDSAPTEDVAPGEDVAPAKVQPSVAPSKTLPVLVVLHGRMMTAPGMMTMSHFLSTVGPAIVVYPSGFDESWNAGYCCGGSHRAGVNDVAFLSAVVRQVLAQQPGAEASRVYLVGYSNGGRMAYRMACDEPGMFAGVAAVEAISVSTCASADPVPLLIVASQDDPVITIGLHAPPKHIEGQAETTVQAEVDTWRDLDGCQPTATTGTLGDLKTQLWSQCKGRGRVEEAVYGGGSHAWFQGCRSTPSAQSLTWAFFNGTAPTTSTAAAPVCPLHLNPAPGMARSPQSPGPTAFK